MRRILKNSCQIPSRGVPYAWWEFGVTTERRNTNASSRCETFREITFSSHMKEQNSCPTRWNLIIHCCQPEWIPFLSRTENTLRGRGRIQIFVNWRKILFDVITVIFVISPTQLMRSNLFIFLSSYLANEASKQSFERNSSGCNSVAPRLWKWKFSK